MSTHHWWLGNETVYTCDAYIKDDCARDVLVRHEQPPPNGWLAYDDQHACPRCAPVVQRILDKERADG